MIQLQSNGPPAMPSDIEPPREIDVSGAPRPLGFNDPDLFAALERASDAALDDLGFGVIGMAPDGRVERYNRWEAQLSGLSASLVLGQNFFSAVAPCTNNRIIARRFASEHHLDETIDYTFAFRLRPTKVKLRLLRSSEGGRMYLLVARGIAP